MLKEFGKLNMLNEIENKVLYRRLQFSVRQHVSKIATASFERFQLLVERLNSRF